MDAVTDGICAQTGRLLLQFHITGRCNLRCRHCYRTEGDVEPLSTEAVTDIIDQFAELVRQYNAIHGIRKRGHINITGGEPFFRRDILQILEKLGSLRDTLSYGILTNGSLLEEPHILALKETGAAFVQLSIDGDRATHDALRAPGDWDRTMAMARRLEKSGIRTYISFTANRENFRQLPLVAAHCRKNRITKLWTDRLVPIGSGEQLRSLAIGPEELPEYLAVLRKAQGTALTRLLWPRTQVTANRALQFLGAEGEVYSCSAGKTLITVDEFGQIMPCRRMPIVCGKLPEDGLAEIYFRHPTFRALREPGEPRACRSCDHRPKCRGGARCQAYAATGRFTAPDPACPHTLKD